MKLGERVSEDLYNLKLELELARKHPMEETSTDLSPSSESDSQSKSKKMKLLKEGDENFESKKGVGESLRADTSKATSPPTRSPCSPHHSRSSQSAGNDIDDRENEVL